MFWILYYANWSGKNRTGICALYGQEKGEKLVCPFLSARKNYSLGYKGLADNLQQFCEIGELPIQVSFSSLDEGNGIEVTLKSQSKRHKSCSNKYSTLKLQKAQKMKLKDSSVVGSEALSPVKTCTNLGIPPKEV